MNLTENFRLDEFKCNDGSVVPEEYMDNVILLADQLQKIREHFDRPIVVISGYRSPDYNKKIGGVKRSTHMKAMAADIIINGVENGIRYGHCSLGENCKNLKKFSKTFL